MPDETAVDMPADVSLQQMLTDADLPESSDWMASLGDIAGDAVDWARENLATPEVFMTLTVFAGSMVAAMFATNFAKKFLAGLFRDVVYDRSVQAVAAIISAIVMEVFLSRLVPMDAAVLHTLTLTAALATPTFYQYVWLKRIAPKLRGKP